MHAALGPALRTGDQQRDRDQRDHPGRQQEGRTPAHRTSKEAGDRPRQHDAEQQPAHHCADHAPLPLGWGEVRGQRDQHLHAGRADAGHDRRDQEGRGTIGQGDGDTAQHRRHRRYQHDPPVLEQVGQRHHQDDAQAIAKLRQRGDEACDPGRHADLRPDHVDQCLGIIEVGHHRPARDRHQQYGKAGQGRIIARQGQGGRMGHAALMVTPGSAFNPMTEISLCNATEIGLRRAAVR